MGLLPPGAGDQGLVRCSSTGRGRPRFEDRSTLTFAVPVVFLVLPVTVLFALFPGLISIVSLAQ